MARKWKALAAVFIVVFLGFFILNGILRAFTFKNLLTSSKWNGNSPFVAVFFGKVPSLVVFNKEREKVVVLEIPADVSLGDAPNQSLTLGEVYKGEDEVKTVKALERQIGINILSFATFKDGAGASGSDLARETFGNLGSLKGGIRAGLIGESAFFKRTNITRIELLRLWWQVNGIGKKTPDTIDGSRFTSEVAVSGGKIRVLDRESLHRELDKYLEVKDIADKKINLEVVNSSGVAGLGQIVGEMAAAWGFNVTRITSGEATIAKCQITGFDKGQDAANYLANVFGCDIVGKSNGAQDNKITIILGSNVAGKYF